VGAGPAAGWPGPLLAPTLFGRAPGRAAAIVVLSEDPRRNHSSPLIFWQAGSRGSCDPGLSLPAGNRPARQMPLPQPGPAALARSPRFTLRRRHGGQLTCLAELNSAAKGAALRWARSTCDRSAAISPGPRPNQLEIVLGAKGISAWEGPWGCPIDEPPKTRLRRPARTNSAPQFLARGTGLGWQASAMTSWREGRSPGPLE